MSKKITRSSKMRRETARLKDVREDNARVYATTHGGIVRVHGASSVKARKSPMPSSILITGGIGDFLAIESFMTDEERHNLAVVCYATRAWKEIQTLLKLFPNFVNLKEHYVAWDDFQNIFAFYHKFQVTQLFTTLDRNLELAVDYSIAIKFPEYDESMRSSRKPRIASSAIGYTLADVGHLGLPKDFICICPITTTERSERNFQDHDWSEILKYLDRTNQMGVVLNTSNDPIPEHRNLINLTNRTSLTESIEILKLSNAYIGIDSCLSVIAAQLFPPSQILIKSINEHLFRWKHIYYGTHAMFDFITSDFNGLINR